MRNIKKNSFFRRIGIISFVVTTLACIPSFINKRKIKEQNHSLIQVKEDKSLLVEKPILYQFETQENNCVPDIPFPLEYEKINWDLPLNVLVNCLDSFNGDKFFKDYLTKIFDKVNYSYDYANKYTFIDEHISTFIDVINLINDLKTPLTQTIDKIDHQIEFYKKKKEDLHKIIGDFISKNNLDNLNMDDMTLFEIKDLIITTRHFDSIFDKSIFDKKQ